MAHSDFSALEMAQSSTEYSSLKEVNSRFNIKSEILYLTYITVQWEAFRPIFCQTTIPLQ